MQSDICPRARPGRRRRISTPVAGGLSSAEALAILWRLGGIDFRGMDVVEVCPAYDRGEITAIAAATVAQRYMQMLARAQDERR